MQKYKKVLRWIAGFVMFMGIGISMTPGQSNAMAQIYCSVSSIAWFVFACALLLF